MVVAVVVVAVVEVVAVEVVLVRLWRSCGLGVVCYCYSPPSLMVRMRSARQ